ncbi:hypothetical protein MAP00_002750 [Monascus purpureus]|nr:hypothetical protein MAP00_002750 [Monascus purpureus]
MATQVQRLSTLLALFVSFAWACVWLSDIERLRILAEQSDTNAPSVAIGLNNLGSSRVVQQWLQRVRARFAVSSPVGPTPAYAGSPVRPPKRLFASLEEPHLSSAAAEGTQATWPLLRDRDACELRRG